MIDYTIEPGTKVFCLIKCKILDHIWFKYTYGTLSYCLDKKQAGIDIFLTGDLVITSITKDKVKIHLQKNVRWVSKEVLVLTNDVGDIQWNYKNLEEYIVDTKDLNFECNPIREGTKPTKRKLL